MIVHQAGIGISDICANGQLLFRYWPPECVVYSVSTSSSHVLDSITAEFLEELQKNVMTKAQAHAFFANKFVSDDDKEIERHLNEIVSSLQKIYLIKATLF